MATTKPFEYVQVLTDRDIIEQARIVAEASKKIQKIKEAQRKIKDLQQKIITHSKYIQEGAIKEWTRGVFEWHKPSVGKVTVSYDQSYGSYFKPFEPFTRDMTEQELQDHCELEIPFEQENKEATEEQDTYLHTYVHPYTINYNKSALAFVVSQVKKGQGEFLKSFLKYEEALDFVKAKKREAEKEAKSAEELNEVLARKIKSIAMEADDAGMIEIPKEIDDDEDISEIFGVTEKKDEEPVISEEKPASDYTIAECESTKYPWNILEGSGKDAVIFERFRTREEAETFLRLYTENKIPENTPGADWIMEKGLGGWKVKKCEYENGRLLKSTFHTMVVCYFEAKQMCENFNSGTLPSEMKVVSDNAKYQIVENPDGSLKTILKTDNQEVTNLDDESKRVPEKNPLYTIVVRPSKAFPFRIIQNNPDGSTETLTYFDTREKAEEYYNNLCARKVTGEEEVKA